MRMDATLRNWLIGAFGLALNLSISAALICAALLLIEWAWRTRRNKSGSVWRRSELDFPIMAFVAWAFFTAALRGSTDLRNALSSQSAFLLFFWGAQALDRESTRSLFRWLCIGAVLAGALGILQAALKINYLPVERMYILPDYCSKWPSWITHGLSLNNARAAGPRSHPLTYAETSIPAFFLLLGFLFYKGHEKKPSLPLLIAIGAGVAAVTGGVLAAQGRAVWLGLGLGVLVFGWLMGRRFFFKTVLLLAVGLAVIAVSSPRLRGRFLSAASSTGGTLADQQSKSMRFTMWRQALEGIRAHPFVGVGLEGTRLTGIDPVMNVERVWTETHNAFLQYALELGLVGLGLFLWILAVIVRILARTADPWRPAFAGIFVAFLMTSLTESWPKDKEIAMLFWTLMGNLVFLTHHDAPL